MPTNYAQINDYSDELGSTFGLHLDQDFTAVASSIATVTDSLALIQRGDGRLKDVSVELHTISPEVLNLMGGFNLRGLWAAATPYALNDICSEGAYTYLCKTAHTSGGSFSATNWIQFGFTSGADAAAAAALAQASAASALSSQNTATTQAGIATGHAATTTTNAATSTTNAGTATTKANAASSSASAANASAIAANTSAVNANLSAIDAAAYLRPVLKNCIINGNFGVNQRAYVSGAAVGAELYGHDRWKMAASGDTYTYSTALNVTTVTIPAGKVLRQVIEGNNLQSGTYTLSWTGTAQGKIGAGSLGSSGITGVVVGGTNLTIEFGPGTVSKVQFESGSIATAFEFRPYGVELILCQRYLPSFQGTSVQDAVCSAFVNNGVEVIALFPFSVPARVKPTGIVVSAVGHFAFYVSISNPLTTVSFGTASSTTLAVLLFGLVGGTSGVGGVILTNTASARILFTGCEL